MVNFDKLYSPEHAQYGNRRLLVLPASTEETTLAQTRLVIHFVQCITFYNSRFQSQFIYDAVDWRQNQIFLFLGAFLSEIW